MSVTPRLTAQEPVKDSLPQRTASSQHPVPRPAAGRGRRSATWRDAHRAHALSARGPRGRRLPPRASGLFPQDRPDLKVRIFLKERQSAFRFVDFSKCFILHFLVHWFSRTSFTEVCVRWGVWGENHRRLSYFLRVQDNFWGEIPLQIRRKGPVWTLVEAPRRAGVFGRVTWGHGRGLVNTHPVPRWKGSSVCSATRVYYFLEGSFSIKWK